tara:strand:+ start:1784 stop:2020 length:237 start_codon:yes stop_codon:yes gene_type:complete
MDDIQKIQAAGIKPLDIMLDGFAEACFNENSVDELCEALESGFDTTDSRNWKINETEWYESIINALSVKLFYLEQETE